MSVQECAICGEKEDLTTVGDDYGLYDYCPTCLEQIKANFAARQENLDKWWRKYTPPQGTPGSKQN